jgi:7,8-dihydropterin-6-yl-methyl-4-(beta-D-ribofuranosyl)aminobenzene 5'-phosphate synthase
MNRILQESPGSRYRFQEKGEEKMKLITLIEDTTHGPLKAEHGLCIYLETEHHKLLFDVGSSDLFLKNARACSVDIEQVDTVVISHGHEDHGGGLASFLSVNHHAKIYLQKEAFQKHYAKLPDGPSYIGLDPELMRHPQVVLLNGNKRLDDELELFTHVPGECYPTNKNLLKEDFARDTFQHEQHLIIHGEKTVLLMGCGHKGVLNILQSCPCKPDVVIGGFHLFSPRTGEMLPEETVRNLAHSLPKIIYYTGHCTGSQAFDLLKKEGVDIHALSTGTELEI